MELNNATAWIMGTESTTVETVEAVASAEHAGFETVETAKAFILAGNARFTVVSQKTGTRFTFKVRAKEGTTLHFVSVLTGSNNEADYEFIGTIFNGSRFARSMKSRIGNEAPSMKAFSWVIAQILAGKMPAMSEIHHEGRCGKCGRALTVPESIKSGLGPICDKAA